MESMKCALKLLPFSVVLLLCSTGCGDPDAAFAWGAVQVDVPTDRAARAITNTVREIQVNHVRFETESTYIDEQVDGGWTVGLRLLARGRANRREFGLAEVVGTSVDVLNEIERQLKQAGITNRVTIYSCGIPHVTSRPGE